MQISWRFFDDIVAVLEELGYVKLINNGIELTRSGQLCIIKGELINQDNQPISYNAQILVVEPVRFKPLLSKKQKAILIEELGQHDVSDPKKFVGFINGENDGEGITIATRKGAQFISYLLFTLYQKDKIKLTYGKGYRDLIQSKIFAFSPGLEKAKMRNLIDGVKKSDHLKNTIGKGCDKIYSLLSK